MDNATDSPTNGSDVSVTLHSAGDLIDDRYRVSREIARGETHVFYQVEDTMLSERLVLKRLLSTQSNPNLVTGFIQVGNASRKFSGRSKRFVSVHTLDRDDYGPYLILDFITAPTMRTLMQDGSIASLDLAMTILRDIAQGLADLHEEGYVHRDIKPDNIFVQDGGNVLFADFGISKDMASTAGTMLPGALSRNYGSPEQAKGLPTTQASDIYAFGVVAYELFSGDAPYGAIEPLTELVPGIDQGISDLVMRCLAQRPERRPQNGAELVAALSHSTSIQNTTQSVESIQATAVQTNTTVDVLPAPQPVQPIVQNAASVTVTQRWQDKYPALAQYIADLRPIPGGEFWMGVHDDDQYLTSEYNDDDDDELYDLNFSSRPRHRVRLSLFRLGAAPVTVKLWHEYCTSTLNLMPKYDWNEIHNHPISVPWGEIMGDGGQTGFCQWASTVSSLLLTLPTEAQWEYAAAGGDTGYRFPWGMNYDDRFVWCSCVDFRKGTAPVCRDTNIFRNRFGLTDMVGNLEQWCGNFDYDYPMEEVKYVREDVREVPAQGVAGMLGKTVSHVVQVVESKFSPPAMTVNPLGPSSGKRVGCRGGGNCFYEEELTVRYRSSTPNRVSEEFPSPFSSGFRLASGPV